MIRKATAILTLLAMGGLAPLLLQGDDPAQPKAAQPTPREDIPRLAKLPFPAGEKLTYEIRWSIFPVGTATLEYQGPVDLDGKPAYKVALTARTNSFADGFFKVRDYNASWVDPEFTKPLHYVKLQHEGDKNREIVVTFDWDKKQAQYSSFGNKRDPIDIQPGCWDPLSITYYVRTLDFGGFDHLSVLTTDGKKNMITQVAIRGKETVKVPAGRFETILVEPDTKDLGGVFEKSHDAGISIWFSDDARHLPVRMASSVAVGSFVAELVKIEGPGSEAYADKGDDDNGPERHGPRR